MYYVKAKCELWTDPRTIRFAVKLGVDRTTAGGLILRFRQWAAFTIQQQDVTDIDPAECAIGIEYVGDANLLWDALKASNHVVWKYNKWVIADWNTDIVPVLNEIKRNRKKSANHYAKSKSEAENDQVDTRVRTRVRTAVSTRPKERRREEKKGEEKLYGDFRRVLLTDANYQLLLERHGSEKRDRIIAKLDAWKEDKDMEPSEGSDMSKIARWVVTAVEEDDARRDKVKPGGNGQPADYVEDEHDIWMRETREKIASGEYVPEPPPPITDGWSR